MRTPFICANWKMYKTVADAVKYVKEFRGLVKDIADVEIVVAPTFTALHAAAEAARNSNVVIAAQDLHWEREGAYTGAIGLLHPAGDLELALAIRTAVVQEGAVRYDAGGGIVADSDPERELDEAWLKTAATMEVVVVLP